MQIIMEFRTGLSILGIWYREVLGTSIPQTLRYNCVTLCLSTQPLVLTAFYKTLVLLKVGFNPYTLKTHADGGEEMHGDS